MEAGGWFRPVSVGLLVFAVALLALAPIADAKKHRAHRVRCFSSEPFQRTTNAETGALDPNVAGSFAILRRPAGPADALPPVNPLKEDLGYQLRSYFPAYIRQLATDAEGEHYFLVVGFPHVFALPPASCLPRNVRRKLGKLVAEQRTREKELMFCIDDVGPKRPEYGGGQCHSFAAVQSGSHLVETATSRSDVIELVPDGVATVRLLYHDGNAVTAPVSGNEFTFTPPQGPIKAAERRAREIERKFRGKHLNEHQRVSAFGRLLRLFAKTAKQLSPETVQWLDASGRVTRSFRPRAESGGLVIDGGGGLLRAAGAGGFFTGLEVATG
jgi:hypothetical protein